MTVESRWLAPAVAHVVNTRGMMATHRELDPLVTLVTREHGRVLDCLTRLARGERPAVLALARRIVVALAAAENRVLVPILGRLRLRAEDQHIFADLEADASEQLAGLDALARTPPRARKLAALRVAATIRHDSERRTHQLFPMLSSQLPRPRHRALFHDFIRCYESALA